MIRRGPRHAKFSTKELRELGELEHASVHLRTIDLPADTEDLSDLTRTEKANLVEFTKWAAAAPDPRQRQLHLRFWRQPIAVTDGRRDRPGCQGQLAGRDVGAEDPGPVGNPFDRVPLRARRRRTVRRQFGGDSQRARPNH